MDKVMKVVSFNITDEMEDVLVRALLDAQALYETRVQEATSGLLSPDPINATAAQRELELTNDLLRQLKDQAPELSANYNLFEE